MATQATTIWQGSTAKGTEFSISVEHGRFDLRCAALTGGVAGLLPCNINPQARTINVYGAELQLQPGDGEAIRVAMDAATEPDLRSQREQLTGRIGGLRDEIAARKARAWEHGDERGGVVADAKLVARLTEAEQALAEFDATYPAVLAEIKQERAAATQRAMWH